MKIGSHEIGEGHPVFICFEGGINANGSVETAKKLIDVAVEAGASAIKWQKRTIDVVYSKEELDRPRDSPWGTTVGHQKEGLEFSYSDYLQIFDYCYDKKIICFASAWDEASVDFLEHFNVPCHKVASACVTDIGLLKKIKETGKPVILSTGMSTQRQIVSAMEILGNETLPVSTTSTYPCRLEDLNLLKIHTLANMFGWPVGFSNHSPGIWASLCAVAMGVKYLELHICLSRSDYGSDMASSIEPHGLKKLVQEVRDFERAKGHGRIEILNSEMPILEKLRRFK